MQNQDLLTNALVVKLVDTKDLKTIDTFYASEKSTLA